MSKKKRRKSIKKRASKSVANSVVDSADAIHPNAADGQRKMSSDSSDSSDSSEAPALDGSFLFGGSAAIRSFLLLRLSLVLLAFDCWIDLVPHGGRYGIGDFNVAHFAVLNLLPIPSPAIYVGTLILTGILALVMALRPWRPGLIVLFVMYTGGWAISMLDSYQHHYLLSLLLFMFIFLPTPTAAALFDAGEEDRPNWLGRVGGFAFAFGWFELVGEITGLTTPLDLILTTPHIRLGAQCTLVLFGLVTTLLPEEAGDASPTSDNVPRTQPTAARLTSSWAYVAATVTCGIVYFYTAFTKLSPDWRDGDALRRLGHSDAFVALEAQAAQGIGLLPPLSSDEFWPLLAKSAIALQFVCTLGFVLSSTMDRQSVLWKKLAIGSFGLAPLSFHLGVEMMGLEIGWFSFYMLLIVTAMFGPLRPLVAAGEILSLPFRRAAAFTKERLRGSGAAGEYETAALVLASSLTGIVLFQVDLPGSWQGGVSVILLCVAAVWWAQRTNQKYALVGLSAALLCASLFGWLSLTETSVRYDYYRFVGGDHRRRHENEEALAAYENANRYLVTPYCVYQGRQQIGCYRASATAETHAQRLPGAISRRSDRQEKEEEMRALVERERELEQEREHEQDRAREQPESETP